MSLLCYAFPNLKGAAAVQAGTLLLLACVATADVFYGLDPDTARRLGWVLRLAYVGVGAANALQMVTVAQVG